MSPSPQLPTSTAASQAPAVWGAVVRRHSASAPASTQQTAREMRHILDMHMPSMLTEGDPSRERAAVRPFTSTVRTNSCRW
ncbi:hypothetical protein MTQ01_22630 [Streptomyces sp. XM4193]|uniref:hypothetical protein n=1 Tax=Streptomyces sp. XM4193 TaxID=2929782 RepID=UPI001FF928A8|nr:hypothetical protein [Streptomyces sp. XM4193]MCK1798771.1 hypothetical protein [Streptomyces sp. XM4193]